MPPIQNDKIPKGNSSVQSVLFDTKKWTVSEAKKWLKDNDFSGLTVDSESEGKYYRFRQHNPENYKRFRTIDAGESSLGVKLIIGFTKMVKANEDIIDLNSISEYMDKMGYSEDVINIISYIIENIEISDFSKIFRVLDKVFWEIDSKMYDSTKDIKFTKAIKLDKSLFEKKSVKLLKESLDKEKRLVYGVVIEPKSIDTDKEWTDEKEIEIACHNFMKYFQDFGIEHKISLSKGLVLVENYINPSNCIINGVMLQKGSWVMVHYVEDEEIWKSIKEGELTGYSFEGLGFLENKKPN
jgi:hypothetical protein